MLILLGLLKINTNLSQHPPIKTSTEVIPYWSYGKTKSVPCACLIQVQRQKYTTSNLEGQ